MTKDTFHLRAEGEKAFGYAQAVRCGNFIHVSGSLSVNDEFEPLHKGDMAAQVDEAYRTIRQSLAAFGVDFATVLKETIYVTDMDAFLAANDRRLAIYDGLDLPATTAVEVRRLAFVECLIEIEVVASTV